MSAADYTLSRQIEEQALAEGSGVAAVTAALEKRFVQAQRAERAAARAARHARLSRTLGQIALAAVLALGLLRLTGGPR